MCVRALVGLFMYVFFYVNSVHRPKQIKYCCTWDWESEKQVQNKNKILDKNIYSSFLSIKPMKLFVLFMYLREREREREREKEREKYYFIRK